MGKAKKTIMLYFSHVGVDPEQIDSAQMEKLRRFKTTTYPNGLSENYKTRPEFRDKFSRHIEVKVRELQRGDASGIAPLTFDFVSVKTADRVGARIRDAVELPRVGVNVVHGYPRRPVNSSRGFVGSNPTLSATSCEGVWQPESNRARRLIASSQRRRLSRAVASL